jgi:hypothetical protein
MAADNERLWFPPLECKGTLVEYVRADLHDARVSELLAANNREVERRRVAIAKLRIVADRIKGTFAESWGGSRGGADFGGMTFGEWLQAAIEDG